MAATLREVGSTPTVIRRSNPCRTRIALTASLAATLAWAAPGWPHAALVRASPPSRAVVARSPERVQLWFNERLEAAFSRLRVVDAEGRPVDAGDARVGPDDAKRLSVDLPPLAPGVYTVRYRVLSVDGHIVESQFSFTIRAPR